MTPVKNTQRKTKPVMIDPKLVVKRRLSQKYDLAAGAMTV